MGFFEKKAVLITGAASGIGRATARYLDSLGAELILVDRAEEQLKEVQTSLKNRSECLVLDLINVEAIEETVKPVVKAFGPLSGFVHCAGISDNRPLSLFKYEALHRVMLINFYSFYELTRVLTKKGMFAEDGMNIVAISSVAAKVGADAQTAYGASKAAALASPHCSGVPIRRILSSALFWKHQICRALKVRSLICLSTSESQPFPLGWIGAKRIFCTFSAGRKGRISEKAQPLTSTGYG